MTTPENPMENLQGLFGYFKTLENRIQELEKSQEESEEQIKSLQKQVDEMKTQKQEQRTPDEGLLRGGEGDSGDAGLVKGVKVVTGEKVVTRPNGNRNGDPGQEISASQSITSCSDGVQILPSPRSPKQWIYPHGNGNTKNVEVLYDFQVDGEGWIVIQKRAGGPREEFNRTWDEYTKEFGSLDGNFWLGLENIHALTKDGDQELRIELEDFEGEKAWAKYSSFSISDAADFYRLEISGFSGDSTAGDLMTDSTYGPDRNVNGMKFSTWDKDNNLASRESCAEYSAGGGWWFNHRGMNLNLNGPYRQTLEDFPDDKGICWIWWETSWKSLAKTEMKIRQKKSE